MLNLVAEANSQIAGSHDRASQVGDAFHQCCTTPAGQCHLGAAATYRSAVMVDPELLILIT